MNDETLDAIEACANAATPGPWEHGGNDGLVWPERVGDPVSASTEPEDADFIAAARTDVPALVAEVRRLRAEREHMELHPTGTVDWLKNRVNELTAELDAVRARSPQELTNEPGPDVTRVYDAEGDMWIRSPHGWRLRTRNGDGDPWPSWQQIADLYGPMTARAALNQETPK